jgi:ketosteroid isomerase-like protein
LNFNIREAAMRATGVLGLILLSGVCTAAPPAAADNAELKRQVMATERAFAKTMADRDYAAFGSFISEEAVFFSQSGVSRGRQSVVDAWKPLYDKPAAPFSWEPEKVEVLDSGTLALSSGPVRDPKGKVFATFSSIWRQESPGVWKIVFDKGNEVCDYEKN